MKAKLFGILTAWFLFSGSLSYSAKAINYHYPCPTITVTLVKQTNVSCFGDANASATVSASGGTVPYTYSWAPSGGSSATASNLTAGSYTVTVTDSNGCTGSLVVTISQPVQLKDSVRFLTNIRCFGSKTGRITMGVSGGTPGYTYVWAPSGGSGVSASNLSAGTYTFTVTDKNGCSAKDSITITQPTVLKDSIVSSSNVSCKGGNNGSATAGVKGGTPTYKYAWAPSGGSNATASNLTAGTYTITVTDANGCTATASITITQPTTALTVTTFDVASACGKNNGSAGVDATGGTDITYLWSTGNTTDSITGLAQGTYTCTITDSAGCSVQSVIIVPDSSTLTATITSSTNVSPCFGDHNGSAIASVSGGSPGYTYNWAPSGGTNDTATGLTAGTYTFTVTDSKGCEASAIVTITRPKLLVDTVTTQLNVSCNGGANGRATVGVAGGVTPYTYLWSPSGGTNVTATGLSAGTYKFTVTDNLGCKDSTTVIITQPAPIADSNVILNENCFGDTNGRIAVYASGGTPGYRYNWSTGATTTSIISLSAGTYIVRVRDANFCTTMDTVIVNQPAKLVDSAISMMNVACFGSNSGSIIMGVSGGTTPYSYSWSPNVGNTASVTDLTAGTYTCSVTDANGCMASASASITQPASALSAVSATINASCAKSNGSASVTASGGTPSYTYNWAPSGGTTAIASGLVAGSYTCTITDANGCTFSAIAIVSDSSTLSAGIASKVDVQCNGDCNGSAVSSSSGGTPPYTYTWSNGATSSSVTGLCAGTFNIKVTDSKGCSSLDTVTITQPPALMVAIDSAIGTLCNDTLWASVSGGTPGYTYTWSPGGQTSDTIMSVCPGTYTVTVTDKNGCTQTEILSVPVPAGVDNYTDPEVVKIYPVPATNILNINIVKQGFELQYIVIYDITGREILEQKAGNNLSIIPVNVSGLKTGTYLIKLAGNSEQRMFRFAVISN